jgi:hypothetical protein
MNTPQLSLRGRRIVLASMIGSCVGYLAHGLLRRPYPWPGRGKSMTSCGQNMVSPASITFVGNSVHRNDLSVLNCTPSRKAACHNCRGNACGTGFPGPISVNCSADQPGPHMPKKKTPYVFPEIAGDFIVFKGLQ